MGGGGGADWIAILIRGEGNFQKSILGTQLFFPKTLKNRECLSKLRMFLRLASELKMNQTISTTQQSFYSPKESSLSIVGPLGLSGSLFLGLLVLDFYHPTNRHLYSPKESAQHSPCGSPCQSGSHFLGLLVFDFYHPTNHNLYLLEG